MKKDGNLLKYQLMQNILEYQILIVNLTQSKLYHSYILNIQAVHLLNMLIILLKNRKGYLHFVFKQIHIFQKQIKMKVFSLTGLKI